MHHAGPTVSEACNARSGRGLLTGSPRVHYSQPCSTSGSARLETKEREVRGGKKEKKKYLT